MTHHDDIKKRVAHHEAGHAIVAWVLLERVKRLHLDGLDGGMEDSLPRWRHPSGIDNLDHVDLHGQILFGGEAAEIVLLQEHYDSEERLSRNDRDKLQQLAEHFHEGGEAEWLAEMKDAAILIVEDHWNKLCDLAEALYEKKELNQKEIHDILDSEVILKTAYPPR